MQGSSDWARNIVVENVYREVALNGEIVCDIETDKSIPVKGPAPVTNLARVKSPPIEALSALNSTKASEPIVDPRVLSYLLEIRSDKLAGNPR